MERDLSTPLIELPTYLSSISMVVDDRTAIIQSLVQAERKSPPIYEPARALFCRILEGSFNFQQAMIQARALADETERKCAVEVLQASEEFLCAERPTRVGIFPAMTHPLPNGMELSVSPILIRHFNPQRLMVLHFWRTPLSAWQLSAAGAVLRSALLRQQPQYSSCEVDFISVAVPNLATQRRFERYNWSKLRPLGPADLDRFWNQFLAAWSQYQRKGPREIKRKHMPSLFDRRTAG